MTDSGSFDPGDLIYAADMNNLNTLVNAKCALAGVAGSGVGSVSAGNTVTAAHMSAIVAAYQRAWDASTNKPGVRQSTVVSGGVIYGSLFQNMWTQLNLMTFNPWASWDQTSEAGLAGPDIFVCRFENAAAAGNEEGAGGGLSGSDLALTQFGGVAGATGTGASVCRVIDGANDYFDPAPAVASLITGRSAWSIFFRVKSTHRTSTATLLHWEDASNTWQLYVAFVNNGTIRVGLKLNGTWHWNYGIPTDLYSSNADLILGLWCDGTYTRFGFVQSATIPAKWSDFAVGKRLSLTLNCTLPTAPGGYHEIFTDAGTNFFFGSAHWLVAAKRCLIDNNA